MRNPGNLAESSRRLRFRLLATHLLVALAGVVAFLAVSAVLAFTLPRWATDVTTHLLLILAGGAIAGTAASALVALAASNRLFDGIAQPVRCMTKMAQRMARGNYAERLALHTGNLDDVTGGLAAALDELASSLEAAEKRRTLSFGEMAHEIRTPVAVLEGYLEGLLDGHVKPSDKTWAMLYDEASRVHRLVDELQALSRAETRQTHPDLQAVDPSEIARAALERLRLHFEEKGLQVTTDIAPGLPRVLADPDQALQALANLLTNALRYTPAPGLVSLSVSLVPGTNEVVFTVTDTGVGIAAEHIPHLFERFFRIDRAASRKVGGSGIGLPVAKALVEAMGGRIWAESPGPGKGSTFSFTLLSAAVQRGT
ncbi:MAG: HAMP domain-containing histidine kinase [Chloroflexota bacterium]|nr:HAMP domain-containing histidine kinase [Chloroflexota bacterium]